jgi:hypothetical protein
MQGKLCLFNTWWCSNFVTPCSRVSGYRRFGWTWAELRRVDQSVKFQLVLARTIILGFRSRRDPWPRFLFSPRHVHVYRNGACSSTTEAPFFLNRRYVSCTALVPPLYQYVETRSIEVFWLLSQPLPHLVGYHLQLLNVLERISRLRYEPLYATNTSHRKLETFLYYYPFQWIHLFTKKRTTERCSSVVNTSSTVAILTTETSAWTCACASATWTVLPPSDTHRTPITAILLPFLTYLLARI